MYIGKLPIISGSWFFLPDVSELPAAFLLRRELAAGNVALSLEILAPDLGLELGTSIILRISATGFR